jgi:hypothetical protein
MMPAMASGFSSSAISAVSAVGVTVCSFNSSSFSPGVGRRT